MWRTKNKEKNIAKLTLIAMYEKLSSRNINDVCTVVYKTKCICVLQNDLKLNKINKPAYTILYCIYWEKQGQMRMKNENNDLKKQIQWRMAICFWYFSNRIRYFFHPVSIAIYDYSFLLPLHTYFHSILFFLFFDCSFPAFIIRY